MNVKEALEQANKDYFVIYLNTTLVNKENKYKE